MSIVHYVNLTNGIEAIQSLDNGFRFIRIQSTACEQGRWDFILQDLDTDFLMNLALGNVCMVYDYGRKGMPRSLWQGIPFIKFTLCKLWLGKEDKVLVRGHDVTQYFSGIHLEDRTLAKLRYFKKFVHTDEIHLLPRWKKTEHDGDYALYKEMLHRTRQLGLRPFAR